MDYGEERFFRNNRHHRYNDMWDDDIYPEKYRMKDEHCRHCGCEPYERHKGCRCDCHSHHHRDDRRHCCGCRSHDESGRWCHCDCHGHPGNKGVCRELAMILKEQKNANKQDCGCTSSIQQLTGYRRNKIIPFMLITRGGRLFVEWGRDRHRSYGTVFFSVVRVNCRHNEAVLELLKPKPPITNMRTGRIDQRKIREVEYVVPTGERVFVDLTSIREVKRLPRDLVKR